VSTTGDGRSPSPVVDRRHPGSTLRAATDGLLPGRAGRAKLSEVTVIRFADVAIDTDAREVRRAGEAVDVQPQVFDVLIHLIRSRGRVVSKEELLDEVWKHRFVTESALTSRIKSARQAIGDNGRDQRMIRTMHGRGYRFVAPVDEDPSDGVAAPSPTGSRSAGDVRLPVHPTPFVGREFELGVVKQLVEDPTTRLVTIIGPGGMGKTRLAIAAAERLSTGFDDGVVFVPLAPIDAPGRVAEAVADAVELGLDARTDPVAQLQAYLRGKRVLLVFDNVEHLLPLDIVADVLDAAPGVRVLATSRERLGLRAERVLELGGMGWSSPGGSNVDGGGAVELFMRSARSAKADLEFDDRSSELVRRICRLVGGMPLAIELAAGWADVLSVDGIAAEIERGLEFLQTDLRDVPERHRSIRSVCDSSWARLAPEERDVFMKLSVFRGGFTRADAGVVAGSTLVTLRRLVATSMVSIAGDDRYAIHELLRQYGEQALAEAGQVPEVRRLHSDHHLARLADRASSLKGGRQLDAVGEIVADFDNIRAAWSDAAANGRTAAMEGAIEALWLFFDTRGSSGAMVPMIDEALRALDLPAGDGPDRSGGGTTLGPVLRAARGIASAERGDLDEGRRLLESAAEQLDAEAGRSGDRSGRAWAALTHLWLGWVDFLLARNADACAHGELGLAHYEAVGDRWGVARCQYLLGNNDTALGRLTSAERTLRACCATADSIGDVRGASLARRNLSILAGWFGEYGEARVLLDEVLATCRVSGDRLGLAYALRELGKIDTAEGRLEDAIAVLEESISVTDGLENRWESAVTEDDLGNALVELGDLVAAEASLRRCLDAALEHGNRYYVARCTGDLGALSARRGDLVEAGRLLGEARLMWEQIGHTPYSTWVTVQLAHLAAADDGGTARAEQLYAAAIAWAIEHGLAPYALDVVVGAAALGCPDAVAERASNLHQVIEHGAASAAVRRRAEALLARLDACIDATQPASGGDWRELAARVASALER
jgi:predicted ATPase/DNA-binding winged helix-turn-helix (wHTH) protein